MKMAEKFSYRIENTVGKGETACYKQFLLFPLCFLKALKACNIKGLFGKSYTIKDLDNNIEATGQNNTMHTPITTYYRCFEGKINAPFG